MTCPLSKSVFIILGGPNGAGKTTGALSMRNVMTIISHKGTKNTKESNVQKILCEKKLYHEC